ncbi:anaerobic glycerol-3-phosphate dehydrogenase subunit C [Candidatus Chlorohelix sp.]|uniref:anaerobic glycerol-3-phosphate dehydrogenase subunit C n=1 Tax=Candidatus Chlorohelix sp. TaxID=3139201 RepID=UPI003073C400
MEGFEGTGESEQALGALNSTVVNYDDPEFWDRKSLRRELIRQFDVCHGCRMCVNYCPSFPTLFKFVDKYDGDAHQLTRQETDRVVDLCFNCKLCFVKCPYTPPHEFMIDLPKLVQRDRAQRAKKKKLTLTEKILSNPELLGKVSSLIAPVANFANTNMLGRIVVEATAGIDHRAILPAFQRETFMKWWNKRLAQKKASAQTATNGKVALFHTCMVNYQSPQIGKDLVAVLEKNNVEIVVPEGQRCCGMPQLDAGDVVEARQMMQHNVNLLNKYVKQGYDVIVPEPTCSMMLRKEYKDQIPGAKTENVAAHTFDALEYLFKMKRAGKLNTDFKNAPGKLVYHMPCHLKYQAIGKRSFDLLKSIPGTDITFIDKGCCGHSGSWGMRKENYDAGMKVGNGLFEEVKKQKEARVVTDCQLAGLQIQQGTGKPASHPIEIVAEAYGLKDKK